MRCAAIAALCYIALAACSDDEAQPQSTALKRGEVDTTLAIGEPIDRYKHDGATPAKGKHFAGFPLTWVDHGQPFPREWARFALVDNAGDRTTVSVLSPLTPTFPDKPDRGQPLRQVVALEIADGRKPETLELSSAVKTWPFAAKFKVSD